MKCTIKDFHFSLNPGIFNILKFFIFLLLTFLVTNKNLIAQKEELGVIQRYYNGGLWMDFNNSANSLYQHLSAEAYDLLARRSASINSLSSLTDWQERQKWIKETLMEIVGPFPEKTPLNARITRVVKKEDYRIEHIIFESQPGFYVTSSLFIPAGTEKKGKMPVVIYCSGHSDDGYRYETYQHIILNLVKKNFIVFAFDPVGQGERIEYFDPASGKSVVGGATAEHNQSGVQAFITGSSQASYMIWDGIRAVDYLLTRKEIDPERIGITGRSGGGTQSAYIAAFDNRIKAAAPENWITNFGRLIQSIGPQDAEQNLLKGIFNGIDQADFLSVRAPNPVLLITTTRDIFSIQGARETAKEVSAIYNAYEKEKNFSMIEDDAMHESTKKIREAMYAFFREHLDNPGNSEDIVVETLSTEDLRVTPTGQVSTSLGRETIFSLNKNEAERLMDKLESSRKNTNIHFANVIHSAMTISGYQEPYDIQEPVFTGRYQRNGYVIEKYFIKGEGEYIIPYLLIKPLNLSNKAIIYLHPSGKSAEVMVNGEIEWFVKQGFIVLAPDLLGIGETGLNFSYWNDMPKWFLSVLINRSITGIRTGDLLRLIHLLQQNNSIEEIFALARKEMSPVLLHAAAFEPVISRIALVEPFSSYRSLVQTRFYNPEFIPGAVHDVLKCYDLPDLAASLVPRKLIMIGVTDGSGENNNADDINRDINFIKKVYKAQNAMENLYITTEKPDKNIFDLYLKWIK